MQQQIVICFLGLVAAAFVAGQGGSCNGASEGSDVVSGAYYYTCTGGKLVNAGCLDDSQNKVPIGSTFVTGHVQKTCQVDSSGHITTACTACVTDDGKTVTAGSTVDSGMVYFNCVQNGEGVDLQVAGCIVNGQRVPVDGKVTQGNQVLVCQKTTNKDAAPVPAGCVGKDGQTYIIGAQFQDDTTMYHCKNDGAQATAKAIGCVQDGKGIKDLDLFQKGDNFYRCRVADTTVSSDLWGCALKNADGTTEPKSIACTWDTGSDPINYVNCCIKKGDQAKITQLYCLYTYMGGRIQVDIGCFRVFDSVAAGCKQNSDGTLTMNTWDAKDASSTLAAGLHQC